MSSRHVVILSGGAGTRLWPLSREAYPKQFFDLLGSGEPMLATTLRRFEDFGPLTIITTEALKPGTQGLLNKAGLQAQVVGEPQPRNTAPAVLLAALICSWRDPRAVVGVFPADHDIQDVPQFRRIIDAAYRKAEEGHVVTLGLCPDQPSTAYGYMELAGDADHSKIAAIPVKRFLEKPSRDKAQALIATGKVVWNAGMFLFRADVMLQLFAQHLPETYALLSKLKPDLSNLPELYAALKSESVDVGIMEKLSSLVCFPANIGWSDIGSWEEVAKRTRSVERPLQVGGESNFYLSLLPSHKRVVCVGVSDTVVVDTPDALLLVKRGHGQELRDAVGALKAEHSSTLQQHVFEERPWGRFEVLLDTENFKSKRITVLPQQKLSYQSHAKRAEHWIVVKGEAEVTLNDQVHRLRAGEHIHIPLGAKHRMANPGSVVLEFIEVQTGTYFGEDDIVRYSDAYGRS
ncbi:MAG: mannose-1-phosphate guanylyltransferase/mannose-6-phosphate isomerase [Bdellovibrionales bacterium]|nr:mannose-1-phosphate guanylyltransferase/mannose-6-phosphate isomerase [Bdellovibrionales bacterium]